MIFNWLIKCIKVFIKSWNASTVFYEFGQSFEIFKKGSIKRLSTTAVNASYFDEYEESNNFCCLSSTLDFFEI